MERLERQFCLIAACLSLESRDDTQGRLVFSLPRHQWLRQIPVTMLTFNSAFFRRGSTFLETKPLAFACQKAHHRPCQDVPFSRRPRPFHRLTQSIISRPFREFDLADHHRFDPMATCHFGSSQPLIPPASASRRKVKKGTFFNLNFV